ncbi:MAG: hypothetical protein FWF43_07675, partial [Propionibacteriaceae bacterium]|nr:hypothetical protein [Propionibacteriaceae bacterium]
CLRVRGDADPAEIARVQQAIWDNVDSPSSSASGPVGPGTTSQLPTGLGLLRSGQRSETLAIAQLLLLYHLSPKSLPR